MPAAPCRFRLFLPCCEVQWRLPGALEVGQKEGEVGPKLKLSSEKPTLADP